MNSEAPRFRIQPETTEAVMEEANSYDHTMEYARQILKIVRITYLALSGYFSEVAREQGEYWFSYAIASAIAFDIVTRQLDQLGVRLDLTPDDIAKHRTVAEEVFDDTRWDDEQWVLDRLSTKDGVEADSGLGLFLNVVDSVAPELSEHIAYFTPQIIEPINRKSVIRGFYDGFMPFYTKIIRSEEIKSS